MKKTDERTQIFEGLKKFLLSDMRLKQTLLKLAPNEKDDYSEETRMEYTDKLYGELKDIEREFLDIVENFGFSTDIEDAIKQYFDKSRDSFMLSHYEHGVIKKLYKEQFSDMSLNLIELVKEKCIGYTFGANLHQLISSANSINELLHVMHSYIMNNEAILKKMPIIEINAESYYPISLYGEENEISRNIFDKFPTNSNCGWVDIVSTPNKIIMMIRDKGHALTIDLDISKEDEIFVKYFVPKLCNKDMIEALPGVNLSSITENGATGAFITSKEDILNVLFGFIEKVPTDEDMPPFEIDWPGVLGEQQKINVNEETVPVFTVEDAKEIATETGEKGRRIGALLRLQEKLKVAINKLKAREHGNDTQQIRGDTDDRTN